MIQNVMPQLDRRPRCVCCQKPVGDAGRREPLCDECVAPGEARSYCAKCGARGTYPFEDFMRVMAEHYPSMKLGSGTAVRLPACAACLHDGRKPVGDGIIRFHGILFD